MELEKYPLGGKALSSKEAEKVLTVSMKPRLKYAWDNGLVGKDDLGLIINVGAGIQVGCALYRF